MDQVFTQMEGVLAELTMLYETNIAFAESEEGRGLAEKIHELETEILSFKFAWNSLVPISCLHDEILQEIFVLSSRSCGWKMGQRALRLSWVSRSWREVAIQTSALWSHIHFLHEDWVRMALSRTQQREISFDLSVGHREDQDIGYMVPLCLGNLYRTKALEIRSGSSTFPPALALNPLWSTPAPSLVELTLEIVILPPDLFAGSCPALRSLFLRSCTFSWSSIPTHPGMTKFTIESPSSRITPNEIIQRLQVIGPTLHRLSLVHVLLPSASLHSELHQPRVQFSRAQSFTFVDKHPQAMALILDQISLATCRSIFVEAVEGTLEDKSTLTQGLIGSREMRVWPVTHLEILVERESLHFRMEEDSRENSCKQDIELTLSISGGNGIISILPTFDLLPFPVNELSFNGGDFEYIEPALLDHFSLKGSVTSLEIHFQFVPTFFLSLKQQNESLRQIVDNVVPDMSTVLDDQATNLGLSIISFPQLREILFSGYFNRDSEQLGDSYHLQLQEWLIWRNVLGLRLEALVFLDMNVPPEEQTMDWFEDLVDEVEQIDVIYGDPTATIMEME
ncbi:hypothetical protein BDN72DRAFT_904840 [Pluteus cervinus]|uniref:Uncharacterized protein n=1 Tax=Pluteus cervinus TaxID=181527 RepID=A0ACD3A5D6_9AGAR|nr:hypothetical protein BDN72DRAFT_904840 [Pluteus cervinus]